MRCVHPAAYSRSPSVKTRETLRVYPPCNDEYLVLQFASLADGGHNLSKLRRCNPCEASTVSSHKVHPSVRMPATLRLELFPHSLPVAISFYTDILSFTLVRHEPDPDAVTAAAGETSSTTGYAHLRRDAIQLGLSTQPAAAYPPAARTPGPARAQFRRWPVGVEIVVEVDDVVQERDRVVARGARLEDDLVLREWGLWDFRLCDPDGFYIRVTERGGPDGRGVKD